MSSFCINCENEIPEQDYDYIYTPNLQLICFDCIKSSDYNFNKCKKYLKFMDNFTEDTKEENNSKINIIKSTAELCSIEGNYGELDIKSKYEIEIERLLKTIKEKEKEIDKLKKMNSICLLSITKQISESLQKS